MSRLVLLDWDSTLAFDSSSSLFSESKKVLTALKEAKHILVLFSHNGKASWLAQKAGIRDYFDAVAVGRKDRNGDLSKQWNWTETIEQLRVLNIEVDVSKSILFDDDPTNISDHKARGGGSHLVFWETGITLSDIITCGLVRESSGLVITP